LPLSTMSQTYVDSNSWHPWTVADIKKRPRRTFRVLYKISLLQALIIVLTIRRIRRNLRSPKNFFSNVMHLSPLFNALYAITTLRLKCDITYYCVFVTCHRMICCGVGREEYNKLYTANGLQLYHYVRWLRLSLFIY